MSSSGKSLPYQQALPHTEQVILTYYTTKFLPLTRVVNLRLWWIDKVKHPQQTRHRDIIAPKICNGLLWSLQKVIGLWLCINISTFGTSLPYHYALPHTDSRLDESMELNIRGKQDVLTYSTQKHSEKIVNDDRWGTSPMVGCCIMVRAFELDIFFDCLPQRNLRINLIGFFNFCGLRKHEL